MTPGSWLYSNRWCVRFRTIGTLIFALTVKFIFLFQGGGESFFRSVLASMETVYLNRNPTAKAILELIGSAEDDRICYDHFAFRTFGVFSLLWPLRLVFMPPEIF